MSHHQHRGAARHGDNSVLVFEECFVTHKRRRRFTWCALQLHCGDGSADAGEDINSNNNKSRYLECDYHDLQLPRSIARICPQTETVYRKGFSIWFALLPLLLLLLLINASEGDQLRCDAIAEWGFTRRRKSNKNTMNGNIFYGSDGIAFKAHSTLGNL